MVPNISIPQSYLRARTEQIQIINGHCDLMNGDRLWSDVIVQDYRDRVR